MDTNPDWIVVCRSMVRRASRGDLTISNGLARQCVLGVSMLAIATPIAFCQATTRVNLTSAGGQTPSGNSAYGAITPDARYIVFHSACAATTLDSAVLSDANGGNFDVFRRDRTTPTTTCVSVDTSGTASGNGASSIPTISDNGRYVCFASGSNNLVASDSNGFPDVFVRDMNSIPPATVLVSVDSSGNQGNNASNVAMISGNGRYVAFSSTATNLVASDTNNSSDVFVRDLTLGTTVRVSVDSTGAEANGASNNPYISTDGRYVVFWSTATNLVSGDTNGKSDIFLHDMQTGTTERISVNTSGTETNDNCDPVSAVSDDGRFVAFSSLGSNLDSILADTNAVQDVFLRDRTAGTTVRVSLTSNGAQASGSSGFAGLSANGRYIAMNSFASDLVPNDTNGTTDVFVADRLSRVIERVNVDSSGVEANNSSTLFPAGKCMTSDGRYITFDSFATNLVPGDTNTAEDVFLRDRGAFASSFCLGDGSGASCPCGNFGSTGHGCAYGPVPNPGGLLGSAGTASVANDSLTLYATDVGASTSALFFQGTIQTSPTPYDNGLRCVGGTQIRLGTKTASGGVVALGFGIGTDPAISATGLIPSAGGTYYYQVWFRLAASYCPGLTAADLTNALQIAWAP